MKTTHLAIGAHQDDIEIMAQHGILTCFDNPDLTFSAVVCADGAGSPRQGIYEKYTDHEMMEVRGREQAKAAQIGNYGQMITLKYPSSLIKDLTDTKLTENLKNVIMELKPEVIYTHNPADKHDTHVAVCLRTIQALQEIDYKPKAFYGCEVWRGLDWLHDEDKIPLDVSAHPALKAALLGVFDSQIGGGKRYDLATLGRFSANATFFESHETDQSDALSYALDLLPLLYGKEVTEYMDECIRNFSDDVRQRITKLKGYR